MKAKMKEALLIIRIPDASRIKGKSLLALHDSLPQGATQVEAGIGQRRLDFRLISRPPKTL